MLPSAEESNQSINQKWAHSRVAPSCYCREPVAIDLQPLRDLFDPLLAQSSSAIARCRQCPVLHRLLLHCSLVAVRCYTFGAPRVGNAAFAALYNLTVPETYRICNERDFICRGPPPFSLLGGHYRHGGRRYRG